MNKITNKTKVIVIIAIIVLLLLSIFVVTRLQKEKESQITSSKSNIDLIYTDFEEKTEINEKFEILNNLISSFEECKNEDKNYSEVITEYEDKIKLMKDYFISYYDETLKNNTLDDIKNITDKNKINTSKDNLNKLMELINKEKDLILSEELYNNYNDTVNNLIKSYDDRVNKLVKAEKEAEAKRRAEEESKKQQQANNNKNNLSNKNNNTNSKPNNKPSNGESTSGRPSGGNWKDSMYYHYSIDDYGNKKECWYNPVTGDMYDTNRNYIGNIYGDWLAPIE